jgi:hypothetical protein
LLARPTLTRALHVFVLASLAGAPVLLVTDAQFFIGRGASSGEVVATALIVMVGIPAVVALLDLASLTISSRAGWAFHLLLVGALASLILSQALFPLGLALEIQAPIVILAGIGAAFAYARREGFRSFISAFAPVPVIVLAFVLFLTPVGGLVFGGDEDAGNTPAPADPVPVVMVVFDELAGHALMDSRGRIDDERFPNFADFAEDATWYPNATTSRSDTELAVPTVATGVDAPLDSLGTAGDHPRSLFTLLGESHEMHVSEPWTNLCPARLCEGATESTDEGEFGSILGTLPSLLGHVAIPDADRLGIPSPRESGAISRPGQFKTFIEEIEPQTGEPELHFLHVLLPHKAWRYLPGGERYSDSVGADSELGGLEAWTDDEWLTLQHEQRFMLQLQYTDSLLGELFLKLRQTGLYDESLVVVTADHGVSFRAGDERRDATETNAADILSVPLFVKLPGQARGEVDERPAQTTDVVPTIANVLGTETDWSLDGVSLLDEPESDRAITIENLDGGEVELTSAEFSDDLDEALSLRIEALGDGARSLYAIGPQQELVGKTVEPLRGEPAGAEATIVDGTAIAAYDEDSDFVPSRIAGGIDGLDAGEPLAIALKGRVLATTFSYEGERGTEFSAMVPPELIDEGDNELEVLAIEGEGAGVNLRPLDLSL